MKITRRKDFGEILFSLFLLALSVFALVYINSGKHSTISSASSFDFTTIPTIWAVVLGVLVGIHLITKFLPRKSYQTKTSSSSPDQATETEKRTNRTIMLRTLLTFLTLVVYVFLLGKINFFILAVGFLFAMFYVLGQRKALINTIVSFVGGALLYLILIVGLKLPL